MNKEPDVHALSVPTAAFPDVLTVSEAARLLRVDSRTVIAMINDKRLPAADISKGGRRREFRIARSAVEKLLNEQSET